MLFKNQAQLIANGQTPSLRKKRKDSLEILTAALKAVEPYNTVRSVIQNNCVFFQQETRNFSDYDHIFLVSFGKASVGMARSVCDHTSVQKGVIITNDPAAKLPYDQIEVFIGGHPIPNQGSIKGAQAVLEIVSECSENDLLIVLISGGGSALLCHPRIPLDDLQYVTSLLLKCGADINEINTIRKHLSYVKGGQLLQQIRCPVISLIISDIINDPKEFIASGPTVADSTTFSDARSVLKKYSTWEKIPQSARDVITQGIQGKIQETPKQTEPCFKDVWNIIVANNHRACTIAAHKASTLGYKAEIVSTELYGEARTVGPQLVQNLKKNLEHNKVIITGGEPTVTIQGTGRGGRNQEMILAAIKELADTSFVFSSFATDGIDGLCDAAGAIADGRTLQRARNMTLDPDEFLNNNDSYSFFTKLADNFFTGPTGTNVMDIQLLVS